MLMLLEYDWPWMLVGVLLIVIGVISLNLSPLEWVKYILSLPFMVTVEQTETEKAQTNQPVEEILSANPGCFLLIFGVIFLGYGLFRWWS